MDKHCFLAESFHSFQCLEHLTEYRAVQYNGVCRQNEWLWGHWHNHVMNHRFLVCGRNDIIVDLESCDSVTAEFWWPQVKRHSEVVDHHLPPHHDSGTPWRSPIPILARVNHAQFPILPLCCSSQEREIAALCVFEVGGMARGGEWIPSLPCYIVCKGPSSHSWYMVTPQSFKATDEYR